MQIIFGIDNALFISIEANKLEASKRKKARNIGIMLAAVARGFFLVVLLWSIKRLQTPFWIMDWGFIKGEFTFEVAIMFGGGLFLLVKSLKEMLKLAKYQEAAIQSQKPGATSTMGKVIFMIVLINIVFSVDSILAAIAMTKVVWVMVVAIGISALLMIFLSEKLSKLLDEFKIFTYTGLQILTLVAIILIGEGGHKGHFEVLGWHVHPIDKVWMFVLIATFVYQDICLLISQRKTKKLVTP